MNRRDKQRLIFWNLKAGKQLTAKIILGLTFILTLIFCTTFVLYAWISYTGHFNQMYMTDCYYYKPVQQVSLTEASLSELTTDFLQEQEACHAQAASAFLTLKPTVLSDYPKAGNTQLLINGASHEIQEYFLYNRRSYQNIYDAEAPVELALYCKELSVCTDKIASAYGSDYLYGNYPEHPGEIMLDSYILKLYGISEPYDELLGSTISLYDTDSSAGQVLLQDYTLSGILSADLLAARESLSANDPHYEHIYVNLKSEDMSGYTIENGSVRYYFDTYTDYVTNYEHKNLLLERKLSQLLTMDANGLQLTYHGIEYSLLYQMMHTIGRLLLIIVAVLVLVVSLSVSYLLYFYKHRNVKYLSMLGTIGLPKRERHHIYLSELMVMTSVSAAFAIYLSAVFYFLLTYVMRQTLDFALFIL